MAIKSEHARINNAFILESGNFNNSNSRYFKVVYMRNWTTSQEGELEPSEKLVNMGA